MDRPGLRPGRTGEDAARASRGCSGKQVAGDHQAELEAGSGVADPNDSALRPMLKNRADIKTLIFAAAITAVWYWNWSLPEFRWAPFLLACFGGVCVSSMVHNHVHLKVFRG